jgi:putative sterol carrier protein
MADFDISDPSAIEPQRFAELVRSASGAQLNEVMSGEHRDKIIAEIFNRMPQQFRADKAGSTNAVIQWNITGRPDGGSDVYQVNIANGECTVAQGAQADPKVEITLAGPEFLKLIAGAGNPTMMFMTGKLKAKGDIMLAGKLGELFSLPKA